MERSVGKGRRCDAQEKEGDGKRGFLQREYILSLSFRGNIFSLSLSLYGGMTSREAWQLVPSKVMMSFDGPVQYNTNSTGWRYSCVPPTNHSLTSDVTCILPCPANSVGSLGLRRSASLKPSPGHPVSIPSSLFFSFFFLFLSLSPSLSLPLTLSLASGLSRHQPLPSTEPLSFPWCKTIHWPGEGPIVHTRQPPPRD
jgi:hypothetical protein